MVHNQHNRNNQHHDKTRKKVGVVGANGYSGLELARLLLHHPYADLQACFVRDATWNLSHEIIFSNEDLKREVLDHVKTLETEQLIHRFQDFDTLFLATPPSVSMNLLHSLPLPLDQTKTFFIDLSGAFRLPAPLFTEYYKEEHLALELLQTAEYGLVPWQSTLSSQLVSNPGCFATSCLLALIPVLRDQLIDPYQVVIDAKSGTTGAGRQWRENLLFSEVEGDCTPYKIGHHQHLPEISESCWRFAGVRPNLQMTTHLLPIRRGLISSLYLKPSSDLKNKSDTEIMDLISQSYAKAYAHYPFVKWGSAQTEHKMLSLRSVVGSPRTHIVYVVEHQKIFIFSCLDNLLKGAASQAIENWNMKNSWPIETGLEKVEGPL